MDTERLSTFTAAQVQQARSVDFAKWISCLHQADGSEGSAAEIFKLRFPRSLSADLFRKAATAAGTSTDATWAGPLAVTRPLNEAFLAIVRPRTLLGRIPGLRQVPFNVSVPTETAGGTYGWVGQNKPKPLTSAAFETTILGFAKAAGILVVTEDLIRLAVPSAATSLRDEMADGIAKFLDEQFVDPSVAPVANVSPGSITNGITPIASSGVTADLTALFSAYYALNPNTSGAVLLATEGSFAAISQGIAREVGDGGRLYGVPCLASAACGAQLILVHAPSILYADDGDVRIDASRNATVQMDSAPDDPVTAATVAVSLWQRNLVGLRAERGATWTRARTSALAVVDGVSYA